MTLPPCRSWPELALSSSPERRAGQEILTILRAALASPTGNSNPSASRASSSASSSLSPTKALSNRQRFSYDARMASASGSKVGAVILNDDNDADDDDQQRLNQHHTKTTTQHLQRQLSDNEDNNDDDNDGASMTWDSGSRLESMSPALPSDSPSPALLLGVTPPKRADNPLALDRRFFSLSSSTVAIGAELGLLNFSPPLRDAY